jgi:hypothetical protein
MTSSQIEKGKIVEKHALYDPVQHGKRICLFAKVEVASDDPASNEASDVWIIKSGNGHRTVSCTVEEEIGRRAHIRLEVLKGGEIDSPKLLAPIPQILAFENYIGAEIDLSETPTTGEILELAHFVHDSNTRDVMHVQAAA